MNWLLDQLGKEEAVIAGAPMSFIIAWLIGLIIIWLILEKYVYREGLAAKDDLIRTYQAKLGHLPPERSSKANVNQNIQSLTRYIEQDQTFS